MEQSSYKTTYEHEKHYWWYISRAEILKHLYSKLDFNRNRNTKPRILNIGCGTGMLSSLFAQEAEITSLDFSHDALKFCDSMNLKRLIRADAQSLPVQDESFEHVFCFDIIEHLENDTQALREMYRVLRPGGRVLLTTPAYKFLWSSFDDLNWHKRRYTKRELKKILRDADFNIDKLSYYNFFLFPLAVARRVYEKLFKREQEEYYLPEVGRLTNTLFKRIFSFERFLLPYISFPFGVSLIAIISKPQDE